MKEAQMTLRTLINQSGRSDTDLAKATGISRHTIARIRDPKNKADIRKGTVNKLAAALNVEPVYHPDTGELSGFLAMQEQPEKQDVQEMQILTLVFSGENIVKKTTKITIPVPAFTNQIGGKNIRLENLHIGKPQPVPSGIEFESLAVHEEDPITGRATA